RAPTHRMRVPEHRLANATRLPLAREGRRNRCTGGRQWRGPRRGGWGTSVNGRVLLIRPLVPVATRDGADRPVSIRVSPATSFAPANLRIRTSVEPDADNRAMEIVADSEEFYRSSMVQLEGDRAPKTTIVEFRSLPPGEYRVTASVFGSNGRQR